jgi:uncharacterized protein
MSVVVPYKGFSLELLGKKALWIKELKCLLFADLHFGKASHFRKSGIPIPEPVHDQDFKNLEFLLETLQPKHTYFLGDLFHSIWNEQWEVLDTFLRSFSPIEFHLVKGNHDILPASLYKQSILKIHQEPLVLECFSLAHEPTASIDMDSLTICGHLHPGIMLRGKARQSLRIPCFYWTGNTLILPSFGNFTGLALVYPKSSDRIWGISGEKVIPILSGTSIG